MSFASNPIFEILNEIGTELTSLISLANSTDAKIDSRKIVHHSGILNGAILTSELPGKCELMLQKFSLAVISGNAAVKSLRCEKQDLERVLSDFAYI